jgi:hypothetical protein
MYEDKETLRESFPSNSRKKRDKSKGDEKKVDKVITGSVKKQKRGLGKKVADVILEDDTKSVGNYVVYDVLIPAAKTMLSDMITGAVEMFLFGEKRGSRTRREGGRSYTSYGSYYRSSNRDRDFRREREISRSGRARHDFDELILETRGEAEEVLSHLVDLVEDYGMATVADLYDLVGITSNYTDDKYGWTNLHTASVSRVRGGYLISLPRTKVID